MRPPALCTSPSPSMASASAKETSPARTRRRRVSRFEGWRLGCGLALLVLVGAACGQTEGAVVVDTLSRGGATARVSVLVTDAPSDDFIAVNLTVTAITLLGGPAGPVTLFEGIETFDLLALRDVSEVFSISDDVPAGTYSKIRLTLVDRGIELVVDDGQGGEDFFYPNIPGNDKLDLIPSQPLVLEGGDSIALELDLDVEKSIHAHQTGNGKYQFRPVVFVRVVRDLFDGRLVRLHGFIEDIDLDAQAFSLCRLQRPLAWLPGLQRHGAEPGSIDFVAGMDGFGTGVDEVEIPGIDPDHPRLRCVDVQLTEDASLFDTDGTPIALSDVDDGERATVVGRLHAGADRRLEMLAFLVLMGPPGTFEHRVGTVLLDFDEILQQFVLRLASGLGDLRVQIFPTTRMFERGGMEVGPDAILPGVPVSATGVIIFSAIDPAVMNAALIVLDLDGIDPDPLRGRISRLDPAPAAGECHLHLDVAGIDAGVAVDARTRIVAIDLSTNLSEEIEFDDLAVDDLVEVYGHASSEVGGCFQASVILTYSPTP